MPVFVYLQVFVGISYLQTLKQ